jgi:DNA-binding MarR family transcriptional regulator
VRDAARSGSRQAVVSELVLNLRQFVIGLLVANLEAAEAVGLNPSDLGCLCLLLLHGPSPAGGLAELTGLTTGAVTGVIDRLERAGLARRVVDPGDRRKVIVEPDEARVEQDLLHASPSSTARRRLASTRATTQPSSPRSRTSCHG